MLIFIAFLESLSEVNQFKHYKNFIGILVNKIDQNKEAKKHFEF